MRIVGNFAVRTVVAAALVASAAAQADDEFRVQAQLVYDKLNFDEAPVDDADSTTLRANYYFAPVSTVGVPVGEAAYINRASYVGAFATRFSIADEDLDAFGAEVSYHVPETIFFGRVGVVRADSVGFGPGGTFRDHDTTWNGTVGIVPIPRLSFGTDFTEDGYDPNITARYAGKLSNDHWWAGSIGAVDPDEGDTEVGVEFDYYFPSFKLGGGFRTGNDRWSVRAERGLPHGFALQGTFHTEDGGDGFGVQLTWRDL